MAAQVCAIALSLAVGGFVNPAHAGSCTVPGSHPTIQAAIDDPECTDIQLFNQSYSELLNIHRSLELSGPPGGAAQVVGQASITGGTTVATLSDFRLDSGCADGALRVAAGAQMRGNGMVVVWSSGTPCTVGFIFRDGFED